MRISIVIILAFLGLGSVAQNDLHFSNYKESPLSYNPALTGAFEGSFRLSTNYRRQWQSLSTPFTTVHGAIDFTVINELAGEDGLSIGFSFFNDQAGQTQWATNRGAISIAYHKDLDPVQENVFSIGMQGAFTNIAYTARDLFWDQQWTATGFDLSMPSYETMASNGGSASYLDLNVGMQYRYSNKEDREFWVNAAGYHLNNPRVDYFADTSRAYRRYNFSVGASFGPGVGIAVQPNLVGFVHANQFYIMPGLDVKFGFKDGARNTDYIGKTSLILGGYFRSTGDLVGRFMLNLGGLSIGASYDYMIGQLGKYTFRQGGPELLLIYQGGFNKGARAGTGQTRWK